MFRLLQRLLLPVFVLALLIGLLNIKDNFGYDPIGEVSSYDASSDLLTPVFSLRRAPKLLTSPLASQKLEQEISNLVNTLPGSSCLTISSPSERIYDHQIDIPLVPGGTQKLLTAYSAIKQIGKDYQYETIIAAVRETEADGLLRTSDLFIFGSGDPLIRTDSYASLLPETYSQIRTNADEIADLTVGMNILFIQGAVVVDESRYDEERTVPGWPSELKETALTGSLSAALFDGGYDGLKQNYSSQRNEDDPPALTPSVDPAKRFAANFDDLLEARNVVILKAAKESNGTQLEDLIELLSIKSPTMDLIVKQMLTNDDTVTAEMLLKEIGYSRQGTGSTGAGLVSVPEIINSAGIDNSRLLLIDGSGSSPENQITCNLINAILMDSSTKDILREALPLAGVEGIVASQFIGTQFEGKLEAHAMGTEENAAIAGYFTTTSGTDLAISFIANKAVDEENFEQKIDSFIEGIANVISAYTGGQPLDELGPLQNPSS